MRYRRLGRTGYEVSEIGYGMWGMGGWTGSDDGESLGSLNLSLELGCNFFDTAWGYGAGHSERLLARLVREHPETRIYGATKIPPKNFIWPSQREFTLNECFPPDHIREYTLKSRENLGAETIDLIQFHVWEDSWAADERWQQAITDLKDEGVVRHVGLSLNRWEPWNGIKTLETGLIDVVQVIYNVFDQAPEDELFPACEQYDVGVIARVPFDEGTLTGTLTKDSSWPEGDWRNTYFVPENLSASVDRAEALRPLVPEGLTMPQMALLWILNDPRVSTIIPGMRKSHHVHANTAVSDMPRLPQGLLEQLKEHRWDREPTSWSQ